MAHLDRIFHSLADSTRRAVITQLAIGPASVCDLAQRHCMALPSFMKHIRVLEQSDIVVSRKSGRVRMCELRADGLDTAKGWLEAEYRNWTNRLDQFDHFVHDLAMKDNADGSR